jgi:coenzyme F420-reducing hydrogenase alpha subunit
MEAKDTGLDERELQEILEMARDAAEKARSMGEVITENSKKWRERARLQKKITGAYSEFRTRTIKEFG